MRFLKSLQKRELERRRKDKVAQPVTSNYDAKSTNGKNGTNGSNGTNGTNGSAAFTDGNMHIGAPEARVERALNDVVVEYLEVDPEPIKLNGSGPTPEPVKLNGTGPKPHVHAPHALECPAVSVQDFNVNPRLVAITQPLSAYCEEYRSLRTSLIQKSKEQRLRSIVVVSVGPSEGKSVTALNLSWLLAQTDGIKALIIDGDMRRPSVADYLGVEVTVGLSDILAGEASLQDALVRVEPAGLYILPAGGPRDDVPELLSGPRLNDLLRNAYEHFDMVIVDAPPLGLFTDATVLVNSTDGGLLVVCANQVSYKDVDRVMDTLPQEKMLGIVLNQSNDGLISRRYYKHPYYKQY